MPALQERPSTKVGSLEMDGPAPKPALPPGGASPFLTRPPLPWPAQPARLRVMAHWSDASTSPLAHPAPGAAPVGAGATANPLAGRNFYLDPHTDASRQAAAWRGARPDDAAQMDKIANTPQATWLNGDNKNVELDVHKQAEAAKAQGTVPVFVAYNIPNRDTGQYSAGGVDDSATYKAWVDKVAAGIKGDPAVVILEPDALAQADKLPPAQREERYAMMRNAVATLKKVGATVYLDAGNPEYKQPADMAQRLQSAGVAGADGFALNTSNFFTTESNVAYGTAVSSQIGGKHFVIDTSRNGLGPTADRQWCNPAGRALGQKPTTATGNPLVDALMWIKSPGQSDGLANGGQSPGVWMPDYALDIAKRDPATTAHPPSSPASPATTPTTGTTDPAHSLLHRLQLTNAPTPR